MIDVTKIKGKNGGKFYVKTFGPKYGINGDLKPVKGGQKWMVYLGKRHIATFGSKKAAVENCKKLNATYEESVKELNKELAIEHDKRIESYTLEGLSERIAQLGNTVIYTLTEMNSQILALKEHMGKLKERYRE